LLSHAQLAADVPDSDAVLDLLECRDDLLIGELALAHRILLPDSATFRVSGWTPFRGAGQRIDAIEREGMCNSHLIRVAPHISRRACHGNPDLK